LIRYQKNKRIAIVAIIHTSYFQIFNKSVIYLETLQIRWPIFMGYREKVCIKIEFDVYNRLFLLFGNVKSQT